MKDLEPKGKQLTRRRFLQLLAVGTGGVVASACGLPKSPQDAINGAQQLGSQLKDTGGKIQDVANGAQDLYNKWQSAQATADAIVDKASPAFKAAQEAADKLKKLLPSQATPTP